MGDGRTVTLWANYGILAHEGQVVWRPARLCEAVDAVRHEVELPEGYRLIDAMDAGGPDLVEHEGKCYRLVDLLPNTAIGYGPYLGWPDGTGTGRTLPMREVAGR